MAAAKTSRSGAPRRPRRRISKNVTHGHAYIRSTFNNTIASLIDTTDTVIIWTSPDQIDFEDSHKSILFVAQFAAGAAAHRAQEYGMKRVNVFVKGLGSGRETAIRFLQIAGLEVGPIQNVTPQAHNDVRPLKCRCI